MQPLVASRGTSPSVKPYWYSSLMTSVLARVPSVRGGCGQRRGELDAYMPRIEHQRHASLPPTGCERSCWPAPPRLSAARNETQAPGHFRAVTNGFSTSTLKRLKSATLRVTTVNMCTRAVAAIIASS